MEWEKLEHSHLNNMSQSNFSLHGSGNSVGEKAEIDGRKKMDSKVSFEAPCFIMLCQGFIFLSFFFYCICISFFPFFPFFSTIGPLHIYIVISSFVFLWDSRMWINAWMPENIVDWDEAPRYDICGTFRIPLVPSPGKKTNKLKMWHLLRTKF